ncbi:hypothetical protein [Oceanobacillus sp. CAU 1775]
MLILTLLYFACFTVLLAYDYFPAISNVLAIPDSVFILILLSIIVLGVAISKLKGLSNKTTLKLQLVTTLYILFLVVLFTVLGGKSTVGLSLTNEIFWIVFVIWLVDIYIRWKRESKLRVVR